ncbi:LHFPL tetraspan subfamily member 6 protein-like [Oculina patagonica]
MSHNLTTTGFFWVTLSVLSSLLASTGYFLPYWIEGNIYNTTVYLGVFRRCNFLIKGKDGLSSIQRACGRYASFQDIPSEAWKACTVMMGIGCGFLLLVALTAILSCCLKDIVTKTSARVGGAFQFLAGFLLAISCGIYPSGWGSVEFKQACGNDANFYKLGHCKLSWAFFVFVAGTGSAFICAILSTRAGKQKKRSYSRTNIERSNSFLV